MLADAPPPLMAAAAVAFATVLLVLTVAIRFVLHDCDDGRGGYADLEDGASNVADLRPELHWGGRRIVPNPDYAVDRPQPRPAPCAELLGRCFSSGKQPPACLPPHLLLGMTADGMRRWMEEEGLSVDDTGYDAQDKANRASATDGLSVCERAGPRGSLFTSYAVGRANVYVCWALSAPLGSLLEALEVFLTLPARAGAAGHDRRTTFFWVCALSMRYHSPDAPLGAPDEAEGVAEPGHLAVVGPSAEHRAYLEACGMLIELIGHVAIHLDAPTKPALLGRMHCLREVALAHERRARVELLMGSRAASAFSSAFSRDSDPLRRLLNEISSVDVWAAECADVRDAQYVREEAERYGFNQASGRAGSGGGELADLARRGRQAVNAHVRNALRAALIRSARRMLARLPRAERPSQLTAARLGALVREAEVHGLRERLGDRDERTLSAINALAGLHMANGELRLAEALYWEAYLARRETLGDAHAKTIVSKSNLGTLMAEAGQTAGALKLVLEVLESRVASLGPTDPATLRSYDNAGKVHRAHGDHAAAAECFGRAFEGRRAVLGPHHADTLRTMNHLAGAHYDKGLATPVPKIRMAELDKAARLYREALRGCRAKLGAAHPLTLASMNNLGNVLHARGLLEPVYVPGRGPNRNRTETIEQGAELLREALELCRTVHGNATLETLIGRSNLGSALRTLGADLRDGGLADEASGLIREAVEGIVQQWSETPEGERKPRVRATLVDGLREVGDEGRAAIDQLQLAA